MQAVQRGPASKQAGRPGGLNEYFDRTPCGVLHIVYRSSGAGTRLRRLHSARRNWRSETTNSGATSKPRRICIASRSRSISRKDRPSETLEGQRHIARVVIERARADWRKWGGREICNVVFYKRAGVCQFSFACLPLARRTPRGGRRWETAMAIASEELTGRNERRRQRRALLHEPGHHVGSQRLPLPEGVRPGVRSRTP